MKRIGFIEFRLSKDTILIWIKLLFGRLKSFYLTHAFSLEFDFFSPKEMRPVLSGFTSGYYEINLQLFAAADEGRTEPPSERRRREEKEKGNVPKSNEVASTLVLLGGTGVLFVLGDTFIKNTAIFIKRNNFV